jgi:hypothetical protein
MEEGPYSGHWEAIATVSAGSRRWAYEVRMRWWRNRQLLRLVNFVARRKVAWPVRRPLRFIAARRAGRALIKLSMIGFARWSIFDRIPAGASRRRSRRLTRPFVLFESNFNGGSDEYFEAFAYVVPDPMNRVWAVYGVPNVKRVSEFIAYIHRNQEPIAYYHCAYPDASTKTIRQALLLMDTLRDFTKGAAEMSPARFEDEFHALTVRAQKIRNPKPLAKPRGETPMLTTLVPVLPFRRDQLEQDMKALENAPVPARTHFARWCIVDRLKTPSRFGSDPTSYLLFSAWFDKSQQSYLKDLYGDLGPARVERVWGNCGFEGGGDADFEIFLKPHVVTAGSWFAGYDGVTVEQVCDALKMRRSFHEFAVRSQTDRRGGAALKQDWLENPILNPPQ